MLSSLEDKEGFPQHRWTHYCCMIRCFLDVAHIIHHVVCLTIPLKSETGMINVHDVVSLPEVRTKHAFIHVIASKYAFNT